MTLDEYSNILIKETKNEGIFIKILKQYEIYSKNDLKKINKNIDIESNTITIVGGSNSITSQNFGRFIDSQNIVLRINTNSVPNGFEKYTGKKTDFIIASEWHNSHNIILENTIKQNTLYLKMSDISLINQILHYSLTTGFISIMLMLCIFEKIQIFGFGMNNDIYYKNKNITSYHLKNKIQENCCHNINLEHSILDYFIATSLQNKLIRGENLKI